MNALRHPTLLAAFAIAVLVTACSPFPGTPLGRRGDEISVCGQLFHTGTPVVLWTDPAGYDAYRTTATADGGAPRPRYGARGNLPADVAGRVERNGWRVEDLAAVTRMAVLHYDAAGTSRQCFKVLQVRGLSSHFLLDLDGTIYQTLDLKDRAWHAGDANDVSVGIEIANIGAYASRDAAELAEWYHRDAHGPVVNFPSWLDDHGMRTRGFVARPARAALQSRAIHGQTLYQYDFTDRQYEALAKLCAALNKVLPGIRLTAPYGGKTVLDRALTPDERARFGGILGHWHLTDNKIDPGPALDWERLLREARSWQ